MSGASERSIDEMDENEIEAEILSIHREREIYVNRKNGIQDALSTVRTKVRTGGHMDDGVYRSLCNEQQRLIKELRKCEKELQPFRVRMMELSQRKNEIHAERRAMNGGEMKGHRTELAEAAKQFNTQLLELRAKYLDFAKDASRVSSMRRMASEFVDDLTRILRDVTKAGQP